jgi:DNA repair protein RecN (Recombination protein N)
MPTRMTAKTALKGRLRSLTVEGFGLIDRTTADVGPGLNAFTGETGSGKSMVIDALGFAFGGRAGADVVRAGAARASAFVELESAPEAASWLAENGFFDDDLEAGGPLVISREVTAAGRSSARVNGKPATAGQLRELGQIMLDVVGQHEHQVLLQPARHLTMLDAYAGSAALALRDECGGLVSALRALQAELESLREDDARLERRLEDARFSAREIAAAKPQEGELERLRERRELLANAARIAEAVELATDALADGDRGAVSGLGRATKAMDGVAPFGAQLGEIAHALRGLQSATQDVTASLAALNEDGSIDPGQLDAVDDRIELIESLFKKHGPDVAAVIAAGERAAAEAARLERRDQEIADVDARILACDERLSAIAASLSRERAAAADRLAERVQAELRELGMRGAKFACVLDRRVGGIGASGGDAVEFSAALNPSEPLRSIAKAASGGELSRLLLALKLAFADVDPHPIVVLDEIDAGIGGAAARTVGARIAELGRRVQVLCVTHLAQIAAFADHHVALTKAVRKGRSIVEAGSLGDRVSVRTEIARMLAGDGESAEALRHAEALLREIKTGR